MALEYMSQADYTTTTKYDKSDVERELEPAEVSLMKKLLRTQLVESPHDVEIQRKNPNSPLHSVKTFEDLNLSNPLLQGIYNMGYISPSKIQGTALPALLANPPQNLIAQAQSGTGKTAAFLLACLSRVDVEVHRPQVLILSPTYELALQTGNVAERMAGFLRGIRFRYAVRGVRPLVGSRHGLRDHVVIGTPGKVLDWALRYGSIDLGSLKTFVLDEADVMIDTQGHHDQSIRIHKKLSANCQMMLFSATYTERVMRFAEVIVPNPIILLLRREEQSLDNIKQFFVECHNTSEKIDALSAVYGSIPIGQSIVFCRTRRVASWLVDCMSQQGHTVGLLSGDLTVSQRLDVLNRFRAGTERVLVTTNVCARGIDVQQVTVVANFELPVKEDGHADCETYLHRIGRSGRFGKPGLALNMIETELDKRLLNEISDHFKRPIIKLDTENVDEMDKLNQD